MGNKQTCVDSAIALEARFGGKKVAEVLSATPSPDGLQLEIARMARQQVVPACAICGDWVETLYHHKDGVWVILSVNIKFIWLSSEWGEAGRREMAGYTTVLERLGYEKTDRYFGRRYKR